MAVQESLQELVHHVLDLRRGERTSLFVKVLLHVERKELENQKKLVFAVRDVH